MNEGPAAGRSVFIVGFMGAGKTTLGQHLAKRLDLPFSDMDEEIERASGKKIHEIFEADGEECFRAMETELLRRIVKRKPMVVATGGGTFCRSENRELIRSGGGVSVWLDAPVDIIMERGTRETHRPLWTSPEGVKSLLDERLPFYRQADVHFRMDAATPEEAADRLAISLESSGKKP